MNARTILAGVVAGVAMNMVNWLLHGFVLGDTYESNPQLFSQEQANPAWFFVISITIGIFAAWGFSCSRQSWASAVKGGMQFGSLIGIIVGFTSFYWTLIFNGFPYTLAWAWLGVDVVGYSTLGAVMALFIKRTE